MRHPFPKTWWIVPQRFMGGQYPGTLDPAKQRRMLGDLLGLGINTYVNLQEPDEKGQGKPFMDYRSAAQEMAEPRGVRVLFKRFAVPDQGVPTPEVMTTILDHLDAELAAGRNVYLHCWGGNGRTGTVVGCWLVRHGRTAEQALDEMRGGRANRGFSASAPENDTQRTLIRRWHEFDPALNAVPGNNPPAKPDDVPTSAGRLAPGAADRGRAVLLGLAIGDAVGTTLEFKPPGTFPPLSDMVGGGPFALEPGQWTDDTSMALCLAESLVACDGFDARDQMRRYCRWWREGHLSSTGTCFDIGGTTREALTRFERTGEPFAGSTATRSAGNGSLMRLAPVPIAFAKDPARAVELAGQSSRTTHGASECVDACRYFAGLLVGLIRGESKDTVLSANYTPAAVLWDRVPLSLRIATIAKGSFKTRQPPEIRGTGYVVDCLEAALWAFQNTDNFRDAVLTAANLGDDADTTAAVCGQIAGACYGTAGLPADWAAKLTMRDTITELADRLISLGGDAAD